MMEPVFSILQKMRVNWNGITSYLYVSSWIIFLSHVVTLDWNGSIFASNSQKIFPIVFDPMTFHRLRNAAIHFRRFSLWMHIHTCIYSISKFITTNGIYVSYSFHLKYSPFEARHSCLDLARSIVSKKINSDEINRKEIRKS